MENHLKSSAYKDALKRSPLLAGWLKVSVIAAASALAGGLAAAWYYRSTLKRFQESDSEGQTSNFGITDAPDEN